MGELHEVYVLCDCDDIEHCKTEVYVNDVRLVQSQILAWLDEFRGKFYEKKVTANGTVH